ncbi:MAG: hypothetical protein LBJ04_22525 [Sphingobacterium sp.]|nr:hypothetical protein [Sphingobacterium sp.]
MNLNTKIDDVIAFIRIEFQNGRISEQTAEELIRRQEEIRNIVYSD